MRILLITQNFHPDKGAVANRLLNMCKVFEAKGAKIEVIAPMPYYPEMEIYKQYSNKLFYTETIENIKVFRCYLYVKKSMGIFGRLFSYFSYAFLSMCRGLFLKGKYDIIFLDLPPLFHGISGLIIHLFKGKKLVSNFSDLWVQSAKELGLINNKIMLTAAEKIENLIVKRSDFLTGQTNHIVHFFKSKHAHKPMFWLKNGVSNFEEYNIENVNWREKNGFLANDFIIGYTGLIGHAQDVEIILNVASEVKLLNVHFVVVGDGPKKHFLVAQCEKLQLNNVHFFNPLPKSKVLDVIASCNAGIIPLKKSDLFKGAIPSKIFDYLALAKPLLLGVDGEAKDIFINNGDCGLYYEPENTLELKLAIEKLHADFKLTERLGMNGKNNVKDNFDFEKICEELFAQLNTILSE